MKGLSDGRCSYIIIVSSQPDPACAQTQSPPVQPAAPTSEPNCPVSDAYAGRNECVGCKKAAEVWRKEGLFNNRCGTGEYQKNIVDDSSCNETNGWCVPGASSGWCVSHPPGSSWCDGDVVHSCDNGVQKYVTTCGYRCENGGCLNRPAPLPAALFSPSSPSSQTPAGLPTSAPVSSVSCRVSGSYFLQNGVCYYCISQNVPAFKSDASHCQNLAAPSSIPSKPLPPVSSPSDSNYYYYYNPLPSSPKITPVIAGSPPVSPPASISLLTYLINQILQSKPAPTSSPPSPFASPPASTGESVAPSPAPESACSILNFKKLCQNNECVGLFDACQKASHVPPVFSNLPPSEPTLPPAGCPVGQQYCAITNICISWFDTCAKPDTVTPLPGWTNKYCPLPYKDSICAIGGNCPYCDPGSQCAGGYGYAYCEKVAPTPRPPPLAPKKSFLQNFLDILLNGR